MPLRALAGDDEVGLLEGGEGVDDVFEPLDRLEPPDEEEIRTLGRRRRERLRRSGIAHEAGKHLHVARESELVVLVATEGAHRDERVDVIELPLEEPRMAPQLRRAAGS